MSTIKKMLSKKVFKSIRTKMIIVFLSATLVTSITSIFILRTTQNLINKMDDMFSANVEIDEFLNLMESVDSNLTNYLVTDDSESDLNYHKQRDIFREKADEMFDRSHGVYSQDDLIYKDIHFMVESYLNETDLAAAARKLNDADEYIARYAEANKITGYIRTYAERLNLSNLDVNTRQYLRMSDDLSTLMILNIILIFSVVCLNLVVIFVMTYNLTKPITNLAHSAEEMSKGNFDADDVVVQSDDELKIMASAFNGMKHSLKNYILELHDKADTESQLLEQQIENLKIQSLLDDAELKALQMQINPHFLFNTLNAGVQLAMIEGADRTSGFLDDIAKIFRYNVKSLDRVVKLKEEIDMVRAYGNLFIVRFGEVIKFEYDIDCSLLNLDVPPLIIQPFVENATIHGIGSKEEGGLIEISLYGDDENAYIEISDDGVGMSKKTKQGLIDGREFTSEQSGHTTGIGVYNVVQRLKLFFGIEDVFDIKSERNIGTTIILKIPREYKKNRKLIRRVQKNV